MPSLTGSQPLASASATAATRTGGGIGSWKHMNSFDASAVTSSSWSRAVISTTGRASCTTSRRRSPSRYGHMHVEHHHPEAQGAEPLQRGNAVLDFLDAVSGIAKDHRRRRAKGRIVIHHEHVNC